MTAELVRGQNHPLSETRLEIRVSAGAAVMAGATLGDADGRVTGAGSVVHPAAHRLPGLEVPRQAAADTRISVDLAALPEAVHRVSVLLALPEGPGGPARFGATAAPSVVVTGPGGTAAVGYTITGLDAESAVVALELYRRQGAWKVRAVGQGYAGGLAELLRDQGLEEAAAMAAEIHAAVAAPAASAVSSVSPMAAPAARPSSPAASSSPISYRHPGRTPAPGPAPEAISGAAPADASGASGVSGASDASDASDASGASAVSSAEPDGSVPPPVAGDATGWTLDERLYNQVWGMFEDLARSVAAYRSAADFAESRLERELDEALSDPLTRVGPASDAARDAARARHAELVERARAALDRDLGQLAAESEVVEHALPPAFARWDSPAWHGYQIPLERPFALRLGDLHLPERTDLRIPLLVRLPLERGLWIDSGRPHGRGAEPVDSGELRRRAVETAVLHAARLLAAHPVGEFTVRIVDPAGAAGDALAPLLDSGALREPPAAGARGVSEVLERLTRRVDLVQMAVRNDALDSLPPDVDTAQQLLVVNDFPHGFDDRAVTQLRYLADEGPAVGVHLLMVADRADARAYGPVLDPLWKALLRITPVADDHLADPWVGHAWTYEPARVPPGSDVLREVLGRVGQARRAYGI
ncbi:TerD family protein [Streptomyces sp. UNOC14_S4]|uniref:TerD family protein n=1 Tax=Streptomyces sp. UNOC14_S4 TaxID=2872340 RepID=UPI001E4C7DB8|nr:TerD family protein [Streptomyces sp. UNOC14_S4]MCC3772339.1 TerD family protein [Streptomyces sp. UNOC14_S4]